MIICWNIRDIPKLVDYGLDTVLLDVDSTGSIVREVGMLDGEVKYRSPGADERFPGGLFDLQKIELTSIEQSGDLDQEEFDRLWIKPINT
jgi:hypothetical protein